MSNTFLLAIDQGTTSTRAVVYNQLGENVGSAAQEFKQHYPASGWVEHDPLEIWQTVCEVVPRALEAARIQPTHLAALGLTNQRETVVLWERASGRPLGRALVWQDRRTADFCRENKKEEAWLFSRTGLVLDPYFSATKLRWLLDQDSATRARAESGQLACGTIDAWLIWQLTKGKVHATDASNASRTLLLNLNTVQWDDDLCRFFNIPRSLLPQIHPSAADFGKTADLGFLPACLPITGVAGDQQAALFGQAGFRPGDAKCTYGTGAFFLVHIGERPVLSRHRLLTSLAALPSSKPEYVLEGSVFIAGAAVQWLRDGLQILTSSAEVEALAANANPDLPLVFVPGFVGLGAPHWVPEARGVMWGLTRDASRRDLARAVLDGVACQVVDLVETAARDLGQPPRDLRVDGGMAANAWFLQRQADFLGLPILQARDQEATARGAAFLAGLKVGVWPDVKSLSGLIQPGKICRPSMPPQEREQRLALWRKAVRAVIDFYSK